MAVRKTISVRDEDLELWRFAERWAARTRTPMSGLVMLALAEYIAARDPAAAQRFLGRDGDD